MIKDFDFEKTPIVEIVNEILVDTAKRGASDIHFDPQTDNLKVRIRIDGALVDYAEVPNSIKKNLTTRIKIISGMNITESRLPQDGAIKAKIQDLDLDLRVSVLPINEGEKVVIRILDYTKSLSGLETLDFSESNLKKVLYMIGVPNGIILVTGATGSGKSTTVYAMLQKLNKESTNIITVEDPIEMDITGINQVQVNSDIGLTFANALRSILRQDPDVIMIGEIRDTETAKIAVRASITGHLVLSTIHTNNSLNTIERLMDMEVERYLLSSALTGIISQKLARRLCPKCRRLRPTNDYEKELFNKILGRNVEEIYSAVGCEECNNGYNGRVAIHEVLVISQPIRDALSNNLKKDELRNLVYKSDVTTLLQDGLEKVTAGYSTMEEVLKLIELENDDGISGILDLKNAIEFTEMTKEAEARDYTLPSERKQNLVDEKQNEETSNEANAKSIENEKKPNKIETKKDNSINLEISYDLDSEEENELSYDESGMPIFKDIEVDKTLYNEDDDEVNETNKIEENDNNNIQNEELKNYDETEENNNQNSEIENDDSKEDVTENNETEAEETNQDDESNNNKQIEDSKEDITENTEVEIEEFVQDDDEDSEVETNNSKQNVSEDTDIEINIFDQDDDEDNETKNNDSNENFLEERQTFEEESIIDNNNSSLFEPKILQTFEF